MARNEVLIPVSKKAVEHGFKLGVKVYKDKLKFPDKFRLGGARELQADVFGFIAESVVCEYFGKPLPSFTPQQNDVFDIKLKGLKIDVKKVGYSKHSKSPEVVLNKRQFDRKKDKIDAFLFCTFKGAFAQQENVLGYQITYPLPELGKLSLLGWIPTGHVEVKAKTKTWASHKGVTGDEAWKLNLSDLKSVEELLSND